jgi:hypothetical protein
MNKALKIALQLIFSAGAEGLPTRLARNAFLKWELANFIRIIEQLWTYCVTSDILVSDSIPC